MKLHEYQSKHIFSQYGIPIPNGKLARTPHEARQIAQEINAPIVLKAQVLTSGRGKAGGVQLVKTPEQAEETASSMFGKLIKNLPVHKILVEQAIEITQEYYLGFAYDRQAAKPVLLASASGGIDIEDISRIDPEKIIKKIIDPMLGLCAYQLREIAAELDLPHHFWSDFVQISQALWQASQDNDALMAEINPLVVTTRQSLIALDAKINIDDNALYRQQALEERRDTSVESAQEIEARKFNLAYIKCEGNIGCLVNGAGLAMATLDVIKQQGGNAANFLDIGGCASAGKVAAALRLIASDAAVRVILINVFGGITRCDEVAKGIITARTETGIKLPIIVRLVGTNQTKGEKILANANLITANSLMEAAEKAIKIAENGVLQ